MNCFLLGFILFQTLCLHGCCGDIDDVAQEVTTHKDWQELVREGQSATIDLLGGERTIVILKEDDDCWIVSLQKQKRFGDFKSLSMRVVRNQDDISGVVQQLSD